MRLMSSWEETRKK